MSCSNKLNRIFVYIACITLFFCMLINLTGCSKSKKTGEYKYFIYYINKDITKVDPTAYYTDSNTMEVVVDELITQLKTTSSEINSITAMPSDVNIKDWRVEDKVLYLNFTESYKEIGKVREILCRTALVLTFSQVDGIEYVNFLIDSEDMLDNSGKTVGNMKASDFVDGTGVTINSYENKEIVLYVADETGANLVEKDTTAVCSVNTSMERLIIEQLQKVKSKDGIKKTIPAGVKVNSVTTKDGVCYVDFDDSFLTEKIDVSTEVEIYSIVDSLCELAYVNKVQFSVNGDSNKTLNDKIKLDNYFVRNLDLLK